jgi:hypothetical protein
MIGSDTAWRIVDKILNDLTDRAGLSDAWDEIDDETQAEIIAEWQDIVQDEGQ